MTGSFPAFIPAFAWQPTMVTALEQSDDRRRTLRVSDVEERLTLLDDDGVESSATVLDESFGGLSLELSAVDGLSLGQVMRIVRNGKIVWAVVRRVEPQEDGLGQLGLEMMGAGLAQELRELVAGRRDALLGQSGASADAEYFYTELPGAVFRLWTLFEEANWPEFDRVLAYLARQAFLYRADGLQASVEELRTAADGKERDAVYPELSRFIERVYETLAPGA